MIIVGLTGSIATGKSFVASYFSNLGASVFDSDKAAHNLLSFGGEAVDKVAEIFPKSLDSGAINRDILRDIVLKDSSKLSQLESIIHPLIKKEREVFFESCRNRGDKFVIWDSPLLIEKKLYKECDKIILTVVSEDLQKKRVEQRSKMNNEQFEFINKIQLNSEDKLPLVDYVIDSSLSKENVFNKVKQVVEDLKNI